MLSQYEQMVSSKGDAIKHNKKMSDQRLLVKLLKKVDTEFEAGHTQGAMFLWAASSPLSCQVTHGARPMWAILHGKAP